MPVGDEEKVMRATSPGVIGLYMLMLSPAAVVLAQPEHEHGNPESHQGNPPSHSAGREPAPRPQGEPHAGPKGYPRVTEPHGWNARPSTVDRDAYRHNYQAARSFRIGPYHRPHGWTAHRWAYGEVLPRAYWAPEYII